MQASAQRTAADRGCTFEGLCQQYLAAADGGRRLRATSTLPHYAQLIKAEIAPVFGTHDPSEITRGDVREWSERLGVVKPVVANRAFSVMRRVYSWALGRDLVSSTPFVGIHKPAIETPRDRVLTPNEPVKVFAALRHERPIIAALLVGGALLCR